MCFFLLVILKKPFLLLDTQNKTELLLTNLEDRQQFQIINMYISGSQKSIGSLETAAGRVTNTRPSSRITAEQQPIWIERRLWAQFMAVNLFKTPLCC